MNDSVHPSLQNRGGSRDISLCCVEMEICIPGITGMEIQGDATVAKEKDHSEQKTGLAGSYLHSRLAASLSTPTKTVNLEAAFPENFLTRTLPPYPVGPDMLRKTRSPRRKKEKEEEMKRKTEASILC